MKPYYVEYKWDNWTTWKLWENLPIFNQNEVIIKATSEFNSFEEAYSSVAFSWKKQPFIFAGIDAEGNKFWQRCSDSCQFRILKRTMPIDWFLNFNEIIKDYENNKKVG